MRVVNGILTTTWWAYAAVAANLPTDSIEENDSDRQSVKILNGISSDFPDLFRITSQYCDVEIRTFKKTAPERALSGFSVVYSNVRVLRAAGRAPALGQMTVKFAIGVLKIIEIVLPKR